MNTATVRTRTTKGTRLSIRATDNEKRLLERAAEMSHVTASQFVMTAALRSAEEVLGDRTCFVIPPKQWDAFTQSLDRPARAVPALERAASRPSPFGER